MGNSLNDYRISIGLYNSIKICTCGNSVGIRPASILFLMFVFLLLILLSGDVHVNPGPVKLKSLSICHVNIRGLSDMKMSAIKTNLCKYDIITLSETFLGPLSTGDLDLPGFHPIIRRDRPTFGGGIAIFIRENIAYKRKVCFDSNFIENLWIEITTVEGKLLMCCTYRPPNFLDFWSNFDENLELVKSESAVKHIVVLGDLNADFGTSNGNKLLDVCNIHNLCHHVNEPTRITASSSTCLDQVLSNVPNFVSSVHVECPVSTNDHCTVGVKFSFKIVSDPCYYRHVWLYDQGDYNGFVQAIESADWDTCFITDDVDIACQSWSDLFINITRTFIPNRSVLVRPRDSPWYNCNLRKMKRKLVRLYHKAKEHNTTYHWNQYKQFRNDYHKCLTEAESNYNKNLCNSLSHCRSSKKWWSTVKNLLGKGNNQTYPPIYDDDNGCYKYSSKDKADVFNDYFLSHSNIDLTNAELPNIVNETNFKLDNIVATEQEVIDLISSLEINKSTGPDGISSRMLKQAGNAIVPSLTKLINMCLTQNRVPDLWKKANVLPLHKKDSKDECNNYRPVSILPIASKILERIVFKHVYNFFFEQKLLTSHQSGFKPNDSTVNQLAYLYHTFCEALDKKMDVRMIFCDISKAFDRVWHAGIIYKLQCLGITGNLLEFFKDYLANRKQRVLIKGQYSSWGNIKAGVPQGSVLGPLLFLVYINDLIDTITCDIKLFADDTTLYTLVNDHEQSADLLNYNLKQVQLWANKWLVKFNPTKTKLMSLTFKKNIDFSKHPIKFCNTELEEVTTHRHLGLEINCKLKWSNHIDRITQSVSKLGDVLQKLKYRIDRKTLEHIYFTFIRPKLEYACVIWDDCIEADKLRLENLQLMFARIVTGAKRGTSHNLLYKETNWQTLSERRNSSKLKFIHAVINGLAPDYLNDLILTNTEVPYNLRNNSTIKQFTCRTEKFRKSLLPDGIRIFNNLPHDVQSIVNVNQFMCNVSDKMKPKSLYYGFVRKLGIIHAQLRMKCSNLKADLFRLHVIDDPICICSNEIEDCNHFFFHCHMYIVLRVQFLSDLRNICDGLPINVDLLLHGSEHLCDEDNMNIFSCVENFIHESGRFAT